MIVEMLIWFILLEFLGFLVLPITFYLFKDFKTKGYLLSKIFGVLIFSYFVWIFSHIFYFNFFPIFLSFLILCVMSIFFLKKLNLKKFFSENKKYIFFSEKLFLILYVFFTFIRSCDPDINGLEKFTDFSILNSILKSEKLPPNDAWYAGEKINYYYFGHFYIAVLTKLSFLESYYTFNLGLATIFSFLSIGVFELVYNMTKSTKYAIIAVILIVFMSNLIGLFQILIKIFPSTLNYFLKMGLEYPLTCCTSKEQSLSSLLINFPVWSSTRVIPNTINEFPYSDFLFGELHAHALSLPIQLLVLCFLLEFFYSNIFLDKTKWKIYFLLFLSVVLGSLYPTNSWDYPTYASLFIFLSFVKIKKSKISLLKISFVFLSLFLSFALFLPYENKKTHLDMGFVNEKTNIIQYISLFSVFIASTYFYLNLKMKNFILIFIPAIIIAIILNTQILFLLLPIVISSMFLIIKGKGDDVFILSLLLFASLISIYCEFFYIDSRYNNVFKFYYHVWVFLGISTAYIFSKINFQTKLILVLIIFLIASSMIMSVFSTIQKLIKGFNDYITLNGLYYVKIFYPNEYDAIIWIRKNLSGNDIILEAPGKVYTRTSIVSSNTGVPTIIGWTQHEWHWRGEWPNKRESDVNQVYSSQNLTEIQNILSKYNVRYIYVGFIENSIYNNLEKFGNMYDVVFQNNDVIIYKVN